MKNHVAQLWKLITENKLLSIVVALSIFSIVPLIVLCFYGSPSADDFDHAERVMSLLPDNYNLWNYLTTTIKYSFTIYQEIQGAFSVNLLIALNPMTYSLYLMPAVYLVNFGIFIIANFVLAHVITRKILKSDIKMSLLIAATMLIMTLQFIPVAESFYWYAGIIAYTLPYSLGLLYISVLILLYTSKRPLRWTVWGALLGFCLGGTNFAISLFLCLLSSVVTVVGYLAKNARIRQLLIVNLFMASGFFINILSPGNDIRSTLLIGTSPAAPPRAIALSFWELSLSIGRLLAFSTLIFFALLLIPKLVAAFKHQSVKYKHPILFSAVSLSLAAALFTPAKYVGVFLPSRYSNITTMVIIWILLAIVAYWIAWAVGHRKIDTNIKSYAVVLTALAIVSLQLPIANNNLRNLTTLVATKEIISSSVINYKHQVSNMYREFENLEGKDVVYKISAQPESLKKIRIDEDPKYWENVVLGDYFGLKSIRSGRSIPEERR